MSDGPSPIVGSSEDADEIIQREWDRFALPGLSVDPGTDALAPALVARSSTDAATAKDTLDSFRTKSTHRADEDADVSKDRGHRDG